MSGTYCVSLFTYNVCCTPHNTSDRSPGRKQAQRDRVIYLRSHSRHRPRQDLSSGLLGSWPPHQSPWHQTQEHSPGTHKHRGGGLAAGGPIAEASQLEYWGSWFCVSGSSDSLSGLLPFLRLRSEGGFPSTYVFPVSRKRTLDSKNKTAGNLLLLEPPRFTCERLLFLQKHESSCQGPGSPTPRASQADPGETKGPEARG